VATKRTPLHRARRALSDEEWALLNDEPCNIFLFLDEAAGADLWAAHGDEVVASWASRHPGTRPRLWWQHSAPRWSAPASHAGKYYTPALPEPRQRLGGIGTPAHEVLSLVPHWPFGVPTSWITPWQAEYYGPNFKGVPIDPIDPPVYESQAAYLQRHGLLLDGEILPPDAFDPEIVRYADGN